MKLAISFFLLCVTPLGAVALPDTAKIESISDFSGGLNTASPAHKLTTNYSPYMRNVFVDNDKLNAPGGMTVLGSSRTLNKVTGIFPFVRESGQTTFLVTDSSITLETTDFNSWTFVSSGSNIGSLLTWKQVRNKMWGYNGVDFPITWDGATKSILDGTKGFPSVPKFKYMVYDQDRVWGFSAPNSASDGYFSSVITTDNVIIAPDDNRAWPTINNIKIGQGDGTIVTASWVFQGQVRVGKEKSIYTIFGNSPSSYKPVKEETSIGVVSNESVVVMDGETHYLGQDGIYRNVNRVSDLIEPDIDAIRKGVTNIVLNSWDTQAELERGQILYGSTVSFGLVTLSTDSFVINYDTHPGAVNMPDAGFLTFTNLSTFTAFGVLLPTNTPVGNFVGFIPSFQLWVKKVSGSGSDFRLLATVRNSRTGIIKSYATGTQTANTSFNKFTCYLPPSGADDVLFDASDVLGSKITASFSMDVLTADNVFSVFSATSIGFSDITLTHATTAQYISDISTITGSITAWGNFDSVRNTNGGTIQYYIRTATSPVNVSTRTWVPTSPGGIIGGSTSENYVQWAATINAASLSMPTNIDNVTVSHIEGQSSDARAFAMNWKNRYWLAVTTTSDNSLRMIYVKSKTSNDNPNAWMPIEGMRVSCFANVGNIFYGGSPSTGTVFRLDYGTNYLDNTANPAVFTTKAIRSIYETPEMVNGDNFKDKDLYRILVDGEKSAGATLDLQYSLDEGDFISKAFSIDGTGRYSKVIEGLRDNGNYKTIRLRLDQNVLDSNFVVNNLSVIYDPTSVLTDK